MSIEKEQTNLGHASQENAADSWVNIAASTAAHTEYGRMLVKTLKRVSQGEGEIANPRRLREMARFYGVETEEHTDLEIAAGLADFYTAQYAWSQEPSRMLKQAPEKRQALWKRLEIEPSGIDSAVVTLMSRPQAMDALKCGLADGWVGSMIVTELSDILFGAPKPQHCHADFGILSEDKVNILVSADDAASIERLQNAADEETLQTYARERGAAGISIAGIGAGELARLAVLTGAAGMLAVSSEAMLSSLSETAKCNHTRLVNAREASEDKEQAALLIREAIDGFAQRGRVQIAGEPIDFISGFSGESIAHMLGGRFRSGLRALSDSIIEGRVRGVVGLISSDCADRSNMQARLCSALIRNNVLVLQAGGAVLECAEAGLLLPEAQEYAGDTLREFCEMIGIPPVLSMGSCVDGSRILQLAANLLRAGGLGEDICDLPMAGMSVGETAMAHAFVASGLYMMLDQQAQCADLEEAVGGRFDCELDPEAAARKILEQIERKRDALGINGKKERKLYDMKERRELV